MTHKPMCLPNTSILTNIDDDTKLLLNGAFNDQGPVFIIYHDNCLDGTVSALMAHFYFKSKNIYFVPMKYSDILPNWIAAIRQTDAPPALILVVDFSLSREDLELLRDARHNVVVVDHHESAIKNLMAQSDPLCWYFLSDAKLAMEDNQKHSGASLVPAFADFLAGNETSALESEQPELHHLVTLAREHDLWLHDGDPTTDAMALAYWHVEKNPKDLMRLHESGLLRVDDFIAEGRKRLDKAVDEIKDIVRCGCFVRIGGYKAWLYYCERAYTSLAGSIVNQTHPISVSFYRERDKFKVSIRTNHHLTTVKANELAEAFGGGGHAQAAGFYCDEYPVVLLSKEMHVEPPAVPYRSNVVINPLG